MASKVIGTVYQTPNNSGQFASGRGAIYSVAYSAPTIITMNGGQICPTLTTGSCNIYRIERNDSMNAKDWAIRKLTPDECWRLMGFTDEDVAKCRAVGMSDTQLYRQAGNSIVTNCIELLAEHIYKAQIDGGYTCYDERFAQT